MGNLAGRFLKKIRRHSTAYVSLSKQNSELRKYRNKHKGQDCIIMGAGPSLNEIPHDFLKKFVVIGTNLSFKYFQPDYWVVIDAQYSWMNEGREFCKESNIPSFVNWLWAPDPPKTTYPNEISLHAYKISTEQSPKNYQLKSQQKNAEINL